MARLYNRKIYVTIGPEVGTNTVVVMPGTLRTTFDVKKTVASQPNKATIQIFNLNRESRAKVDTPGNIITVRAGYADDVGYDYGTSEMFMDMAESLPIVTRADIVRTTHRRSGADFVTEIQAGEGDQAYRMAVVDKKLNSEISIVDVFAYLRDMLAITQISTVTKLPIDRGFSVNPDFEKVIALATTNAKSAHLAEATAVYSGFFKSGLTLFGHAYDVFDALALRHDLFWFLDNNVLTVVPINGYMEAGVSGPWGPMNGVHGIPERQENGAVAVKMNLTPGVVPWSKQELLMEINTELNGKYKTGTVSHVGDSDSAGEFTTSWEGFQLA